MKPLRNEGASFLKIISDMNDFTVVYSQFHLHCYQRWNISGDFIGTSEMPFILAPGISQRDDIPIDFLKKSLCFCPVKKQEKDKCKKSSWSRKDNRPVPVLELRIPRSPESHIENIVWWIWSISIYRWTTKPKTTMSFHTTARYFILIIYSYFSNFSIPAS